MSVNPECDNPECDNPEWDNPEFDNLQLKARPELPSVLAEALACMARNLLHSTHRYFCTAVIRSVSPGTAAGAGSNEKHDDDRA